MEAYVPAESKHALLLIGRQGKSQKEPVNIAGVDASSV